MQRGSPRHKAVVAACALLVLVASVAGMGIASAGQAGAAAPSPARAAAVRTAAVQSAAVQSTAGTSAGKTAQETVEGAGKAFAAAAQFAVAIGSKAGPIGFGISLLASILGPLIGLGADQGPTTQDVLDKLDQISAQLDQIQSQLNQVQAQLAQLSLQIQQLANDIHDAQCSQQQSNLDKELSDISIRNTEYGQLLALETSLASAGNPGSTVDVADTTATLEKNFGSFAASVLGAGKETAGVGGLSTEIDTIHRALTQQGSGVGSGIIQACFKVALDNYRTAVHTPAAHQHGWLDDRTYYDQMTDLVRYYESYEIMALQFTQEAAYFRVTQALSAKKVTIDPDTRAGACGLAKEHGVSDAVATCASTVTLTKDVYQDFVAEWKLVGRPYSDGKVVLQIPSTASGLPGDVKPVLWARDTTTVPKAMGEGTWDTDPKKTASYDGFEGWAPAELKQWKNLAASPYAGICRNTATGTVASTVFDCMTKSGEFDHVDGIFWMPQESAKGLKLPIPETPAEGTEPAKKMSVLGYAGHRYPLEYTGPDLSLRCFAASGPATESPFACGQDWIDGHAFVQSSSASDEHTIYPTYQIDWGFKGLFPQPSLSPSTFSYFYINPTGGSGDYAFKDKTNSYPARINTTVSGSFPAFLNPLTVAVLKECDGTFYFNKKTCNDTGTDTSYDPPATVERLWPTLTVPTSPECTNTVGLPKLCTADTKDHPDQAKPFTVWLDNNIPNPSLPSPAATAPPTMTQQGGSTQCVPAGWQPPPADWTYGGVTLLPTTWTGTSGGKTSTVTEDGTSLDDAQFATQAGFGAGAPFSLTCTINARWEGLANRASVVSPQYQATPNGGGYVLTRRPAPPTIGKALAADQGATVAWTVGDSFGTPISAFIITPYLGGVTQSPVSVRAGGTGLSPDKGAKDSSTVTGLQQGSAYRFTVTATVVMAGTEVTVDSDPSALSNPVTPTTPTPPIAPVSPTTTTIPTAPVTPTTPTTTAPPDFTERVSQVSDTEALVSFVPGRPATWVDLHFRVEGRQQDFRMKDHDGTWTHIIKDLAAGDAVTYWFDYLPAGAAGSTQTPHFTFHQLADKT